MNDKRGSTQQIASLLLMKLATRKFETGEIEEANKILKSIILLRDGGEFAYKTTKEFYWGTVKEEDSIIRQGIRLKQGDYFLSDLMLSIFGDEAILKNILKSHPNLSSGALEGISHLLYRLLSNIEYSNVDNQVALDNIKDIDLNYWHTNMQNYFKYLEEEYKDEEF